MQDNNQLSIVLFAPDWLSKAKRPTKHQRAPL